MSKPYVRPMPRTWFLQSGAYRLFMLRELSSVFVALYALELICLLARIAAVPEGDPARAERMRTFFDSLGSPLWILFHLVALGFALLHTITWFNLTPKVMVVRIGEEKLPDFLIAGHLYVVWAIVSLAIWWIIT